MSCCTRRFMSEAQARWIAFSSMVNFGRNASMLIGPTVIGVEVGNETAGSPEVMRRLTSS
jgi:hypothetical protein